MKGTIRQRKNRDGTTTFLCQVFAGLDPETGKRRFLTGTASSERAAHQVVHDLVKQVQPGQVVAKSDATLNDLITEWLDKAGPAGDGTRLTYKGYINKHIKHDIGKKRLSSLRVAHLDLWYVRLRDKGLAPASIRKAHNIVRAALTQGVRWGWLAMNVAQHSSPPKVPKPVIVTPTPKAVGKMMRKVAELDAPFRVYLRLASVTGARPGEMCALQWRDLNEVRGELTISRRIIRTENNLRIEDLTKTGKTRTIPLDDATFNALREFRTTRDKLAAEFGHELNDESFVFSDAPDSSKFWRPDSTSRKFRNFREHGSLEKAPLYGLRHQAATTMIDGGVDPKTVSERLGNSVSTVLTTYTRARTEADRAAANFMGSVFDDDDD